MAICETEPVGVIIRPFVGPSGQCNNLSCQRPSTWMVIEELSDAGEGFYAPCDDHLVHYARKAMDDARYIDEDDDE